MTQRLTIFRLLAVLGTVLCLGNPAISAAKPSTLPCVTCLGPLTNDLPNSYFPVGGFHRIPFHLHLSTKPEVLLMGTDVDAQTAALRWPLVKALSQFGRFRRVKPEPQRCEISRVRATLPPGSPEQGAFREPCGPPTFDLLHGTYDSAYVAFSEKDLMDQANHIYVQRLSPLERTIYDRYGRRTFFPNERDDIWSSVQGTQDIAESAKRLPLIVVGNELQSSSQNTVYGDFLVYGGVPPCSTGGFISFTAERTALLRNTLPRPCSSTVQFSNTMLYHLNVDANIMAALICHADGMRPKSVCNRANIRTIVRHIK